LAVNLLSFLYRKEKKKIGGRSYRKIDFKVLGLGGDKKLLLNPNDRGFSREFHSYGFREPLNTMFIYKIVKEKKPIILDIGSNLGYFALIELEAGAKHVIAVEPVPETFRFLCENLKGYDNVTPLNLLVSDKEEISEFYIGDELNRSSLLPDFTEDLGCKIKEKLTIKTLPLSRLVKEYGANMIRMDVEGYEYRILSGKIDDQITTICMEFHVPLFQKNEAISLLKNLFNQGFKSRFFIRTLFYQYYPFLVTLGVSPTLKLANFLEGKMIQKNLELNQIVPQIREPDVFHLILER